MTTSNIVSDTGENIWTCKIGGPVSGLRAGADGPMRQAVEEAYLRITGREAEFTFSGWGGKLTEGERAVVERRLPDPAKEAAELRAELAIVESAL